MTIVFVKEVKHGDVILLIILFFMENLLVLVLAVFWHKNDLVEELFFIHLFFLAQELF